MSGKSGTLATGTATGTTGTSHVPAAVPATVPVTVPATVPVTVSATVSASMPATVPAAGPEALSVPVRVVINNIAMITGTQAVAVAAAVTGPTGDARGPGVLGVLGGPGMQGGVGGEGGAGLQVHTDDDEEARHNARLYYAKIERALKATRTPSQHTPSTHPVNTA